MRYLFVILISFFALPTFSQQPSYFVIGAEEFSGVDIYDILQEPDKNYWIATNNGLYKFDHYKFQKINCNDMSSSSIFNLIQNSKGQIFCNNLSGQVFEINDDECNLYFQIPDSLMHNQISMIFDAREKLTFLTNSLFQIHEDLSIQILLKRNGFHGGLSKGPNGDIRFFDNSILRTAALEEAIVTYGDSISKSYRPFGLTHGKSHYWFNQINGNVILPNLHDPFSQLKKEIEGPMIYSDGDNIWIASRTGGAWIFDEAFNSIVGSEMAFKDYFISALLKDSEGNIVLGTFGDGLIIIPNMNVKSIPLSQINERATVLVATEKEQLFIGTMNGSVFEVQQDNTINRISNFSKKNIEYLQYLSDENLLIFDGSPSDPTLTYDIQSKNLGSFELMSLKDIKKTSQTHPYLIANNAGCYWFDPVSNELQAIQSFQERTNCVGYENDSGIIYAGTSSGLKIGESGKSKHIQIDHNSIICKDIIEHLGKVYVATQNNGILIFNDGEMIDKWDTNNGLISNNTNKIVRAKNLFIILTDKGLFGLNENGKIMRSYNSDLGQNKGKILDFEISNDKIFCLFSESLKILEVGVGNDNKIEKPTISKLLVNDKIHNTKNHLLKHHQNKLSFYLDYKSLTKSNKLIYHYKLSSIDMSWQSSSFYNNVVEYKSLPPGSYHFDYYASYENLESEVQTFHFDIYPPYWKTWWFILLTIVVTLLLLFILFRTQLNRQNKIARLKRQTIESKLMAIQSQMNPHFIFNSLNSMQELVLNQQGDEAYSYISKFAYLVRKILQYSELNQIHLSEEIDLLIVYLELEQLRFEEDFKFNIEVECITSVEIPPMIIQPFVENAIKHGLLHKRGEKTLALKFVIENNHLIVTVKDNGIGRNKADEINQRKISKPKSFATNSTQKRFDILSNIHGNDLGMQYDDLINDVGASRGTLVTLRIPIVKSI